MKINGRLLLLLVVTGLFIRVWTANDRNRSRVLPRTRSQAAANFSHPREWPAGRRGLSGSARVISTGHARPAAEEVWTERTCPIPLPSGLAGGPYRVVDDAGRVARLEVSEAGAGSSALQTPAPTDFVMSSVGERRWYFIRLRANAASVPAATAELTAPTIPAATPTAGGEQRPFANRKFDFTGYVSQDMR